MFSLSVTNVLLGDSRMNVQVFICCSTSRYIVSGAFERKKPSVLHLTVKHGTVGRGGPSKHDTLNNVGLMLVPDGILGLNISSCFNDVKFTKAS